VLIASEDLEPGDGWDYVFLSALNRHPHMDGFALGIDIVDTFMDFYGPDSDEILSLSVVDLARVAPVMDAMGKLMEQASSDMPPAFRELSHRRAGTKTFGEGSPRDNYADMVDIGDMAVMLQSLYPNESAAVLRALANCVTYNRHNSDVDIHGLSTFYIYGGKSQGKSSLRTYSALEMNRDYTDYLHGFFDRLVNSRPTRSNIATDSAATDEYTHTEQVLWQPLGENRYRMAGLLQSQVDADIAHNLLWPQINGQFVSLFPVAETATMRQYAIPITIDGHEADIIVAFTPSHPKGKILGIRHHYSGVVQKGYDPIDIGDVIAFCQLEKNFADDSEHWKKGESFTVSAPLHLHWIPAPAEYKHGFRHTTIHHDVVYTQLQ